MLARLEDGGFAFEKQAREAEVNFAGRSLSLARRVSGYRRYAPHLALLWLASCIAGCADKVRAPSPEERAVFEQAGPSQPTVDANLIQKSRLHTGPYRVVPGDVLEFTMPALLQAVTTAEAQAAQTQTKDDRPYICRVNKEGTITLPAAGEVEVAGESLAEVEEKVIDAYRRFVVLRPSVFVRVLEYKTYRVSIIGAVAKPGVYMVRRDQMSLVALLMEAGGIVENGAAVIKISRQNEPDARQSGEQASLGSWPSARGNDLGQGIRLAAYRQETMVRHVGVSGIDIAVQVVFQWEGPLHTTGWLTVEKGRDVLTRRWLDIGIESQRQMFLGTVARRLGPIALNVLQTRLSYLAGYLELHPRDRQTGPVMPAPGWETMPDDQFVAYLGAAAPDREQEKNVPRKVVTEAPVAMGEDAVTTLVLPVRGLNIPFRDVGLEEGDTVVVERIQEPLFSVLGLVNRPGNFPYPPNAEYNVTQAIAFAGGLDPVAFPRFVTIYRLTKDGSIARVALELIEDDQFTDALNTPIKPGDVVAIEHTPRTRANTMIHNLVRVNAGVYLTGRDLWNND